MKIAVIASEATPFVKTGGLADVVGALPKAIGEEGHQVIVILPYYKSVAGANLPVTTFFESMCVWMGNGIEEWCSVKKIDLKGKPPVYFIEFNKYFMREGVYCDSGNVDFADNPYRFAFFSRAALQLLRDMNFQPDVIHVHDWQTAPVCAYMKIWDWGDSKIDKALSVLTIHNIGYQGVYDAGCYGYCGFGYENFNSNVFEDHGRVNFLKGGIFFADVVTTVSPTYAKETLDGSQGCGLSPYLKCKKNRYLGILNGVDYKEWNPQSDVLIPANFSATQMAGKALCKVELKKRFALNLSENLPVIGVVSRFAYQKGLDVVSKTIESILNTMKVQFVVLGSGDKDLESYFRWLPSFMSGKVGTFIGYSNELAHLVEAGSDFFIMPSRYEPCGLNQIYSLQYGTLPIVRNTGGLADTIVQYDEKTGDGTGFKFDYLSEKAIYDTVGWAVSTYFDRPHHFQKMRMAAMSSKFDWKESAKHYLKIYTSFFDHSVDFI